MLTRSQVATILGKSIATVRRMEGVELHPRRNSAGVHVFDSDEVDAVRADQLGTSGMHQQTTVHRRRWLEEPLPEDRKSSAEIAERPSTLGADQLAQLLEAARAEGAQEGRRRLASELKRQRETEEENERREQAAAEQALDRVREEAAQFLSDLSKRELRRLAKDPEFMQLLEDMA